MKKLILVIAIIMASCSSLAIAEERDSHFSLSIGRTDLKGEIFHHQGTLFKILGGQRLSDFISIEAGLVYFGEVEDTFGLDEQKIEGRALELNLLLIAPLTSAFEAYAKIGVSKWRFRIRQDSILLGTGRGKVDGEDPIYGGGLLFNVDDDSTLRLEYEISTYKDSTEDTDIKIISFGFQHRF